MRKRHTHLLRIGLPIFLFVLLLLGGAAWVWSLGSASEEAAPAMSLQDVNGSVEISSSGSTAWRAAQTGDVVQAGDRLRTGDTSRVNIAWGDRGVTRVDANTDLTIQAAPANDASVSRVFFQLELTRGQIWSRVLKLLDIGSSFRVESNGVVATVRGTSFGFSRMASSTEIAVTDSVVTLTSASGTQTYLRDNQYGSFTTTGEPVLVRGVTSADTWVAQNAREDAAYEAGMRTEIAQQFQSWTVHAPTWLVRWSEQLHLFFANAERKDMLRAAYFSRHMAEDLSGGQVSLMDELPTGSARERALHDVRFGLFVFAARSGFAPDPSTVFRLQAARAALLGNDVPGALYAQALNIDDRIDAVLRPSSPIDPASRARIIAGISDDIASWQSTFGAAGISWALHDAFTIKAEALRDRIAGIGDLDGSAGETGTNVTTTDEAPTSTSVVVQTPGQIPSRVPSPTIVAPAQTQTTSTPIIRVPTSVDTPVTQACSVASVNILAKPRETSVGSRVTLSLYGLCADGSTQDLTSQSTFTTGSANDGSIRGNVFIPASAGTLTVIGTYADAAGTLRGTTTVYVSAAPRALTGVDVSVVGPTNLLTGQIAMLDAVARYSDGTSANVSYQCVWSTSDPQLAIISGTTFQTLSGVGTVQAICTYSEGGVTTSGSTVFTISLFPSPAPSGSTTPIRNLVPTYLY